MYYIDLHSTVFAYCPNHSLSLSIRDFHVHEKLMLYQQKMAVPKGMTYFPYLVPKELSLEKP